MRPIYSTLTLIIITVLLLDACSTKRLTINNQLPNHSFQYHQQLDYGPFGIPIARSPLSRIPDKTGEQYIIVSYRDGLPRTAYLIGIIDSANKPDVAKPFKVAYEWTGKGFQVGSEASKKIVEPGFKATMDAHEKLKHFGMERCSALIAAPVAAVGSVVFITSGLGGFVIGVGAAFPAAVGEIANIGNHNNEVVLGTMEFEYDAHDRLARFTMFSPPPKRAELSSTSYRYRGASTAPYRAENISRAENKKRIIDK